MGAAKGDGCVAAEDGGSGLGDAVAAENGERGRVQAPPSDGRGRMGDEDWRGLMGLMSTFLMSDFKGRR